VSGPLSWRAIVAPASSTARARAADRPNGIELAEMAIVLGSPAGNLRIADAAVVL